MLLDSSRHAVGEVLPAVRDHVPGDAVLGREGTGTRADPGETGQVGAEPQVQGDAGAVDTELWRTENNSHYSGPAQSSVSGGDHAR